MNSIHAHPLLCLDDECLASSRGRVQQHLPKMDSFNEDTSSAHPDEPDFSKKNDSDSETWSNCATDGSEDESRKLNVGPLYAFDQPASNATRLPLTKGSSCNSPEEPSREPKEQMVVPKPLEQLHSLSAPSSTSSSGDERELDIDTTETDGLIDGLAHAPHHNDLVHLSRAMDQHFAQQPPRETGDPDNYLEGYTTETTVGRLERYSAVNSSLSDSESWEKDDPKDSNYSTGSADTSGGLSPGSSYNEDLVDLSDGEHQ